MKEEIKVYQKYHSEEAVNKLYKPDPVSSIGIVNSFGSPSISVKCYF